MPDVQPDQLHLTLDLALGADPIAGSCRRGADPPERFVGWLGLMALLERVSARATADRSERLDLPVRD